MRHPAAAISLSGLETGYNALRLTDLRIRNGLMHRQSTASSSRRCTLRKAIALLALACMNLAMLPCSMAQHAAVDSAPAAAAMNMAGHHAEHHEAIAEHCDVEAQDCCQLDGAQANERSQVSGKDVGGDLVATHPVSCAAEPDCTRAGTAARSRPPDLLRGQPRKHLIDCVFLD